MTVGKICIRDVYTASERESVTDVARRMAEENVGSLVVLNDDGKPIGILTDRDLVVNVLARGSDPVGTSVAHVITEGPKSISEFAPIEEALRLMRSSSCRRLPVVDGQGILVGIISLDDILTLLSEEFELVQGILKKQGLPPRRYYSETGAEL